MQEDGSAQTDWRRTQVDALGREAVWLPGEAAHGAETMKFFHSQPHSLQRLQGGILGPCSASGFAPDPGPTGPVLFTSGQDQNREQK